MTIIAHISDIHLSPLPNVRWRQLLNKRVTGYANWRIRRKGRMSSTSLERLLQHMREKRPEFIAVTGDLVNLALPEEIDIANQWLQWLAPPEQACISPGNHDAYVPGALAHARNIYGPYMAGETLGKDHFPFVRRIGDVAIISCSSAIPTPPFVSAGYFDKPQAERLDKILEMMKKAGYFRVLMIHHPPNRDAGTNSQSRLYGSRRFKKIIAKQGAELILHGHTHNSTIGTLTGPDVPVPLVGVAAASSAIGSKHPPARYNLFQINRVGDNWSCTMREFGYQRIGDDIVQRMQIRLH